MANIHMERSDMPKIGAPTESVKGRPPIPDGLYQLKLEGFEVKKTRAKDSYNLNPVLTVVNHPSENGKRAFINLNAKAGWVLLSFAHGLGHDLVKNGDSSDLPGDFVVDPQDPDNETKFRYAGPLLGQIVQVEVFTGTNEKGGPQPNKIKRFLCRLPGCQEKHPENLS